jgi:hypothetical protein
VARHLRLIASSLTSHARRITWEDMPLPYRPHPRYDARSAVEHAPGSMLCFHAMDLVAAWRRWRKSNAKAGGVGKRLRLLQELAESPNDLVVVGDAAVGFQAVTAKAAAAAEEAKRRGLRSEEARQRKA